MPHINDCRVTAMRTRLSQTTGATNDLEQAYLTGLITTTPKAVQINDQWLQLAGAGDFNDRQFAYIGTKTGAQGATLPDRRHWYWCTLGGEAPPAGEPTIIDFVSLYLIDQGWDVQIINEEIHVNIGTTDYVMDTDYLVACNFSDLPGPLENDVHDAMNLLGICT